MTINLTQARELLKQAVETQGHEFVYNPNQQYECRYEPIPFDRRKDDGDPRHLTGCLVGTAISFTDETRHIGVMMSAWSLHFEFPGMLTEEAALYLRQAQIVQDEGRTWGEAHDVAELWLWDRLVGAAWDATINTRTVSEALDELLANRTSTDG